MKPTYSPAEVCRDLEISKTTLLRWEADGFIPAAARNARGARCYTREQYEQIARRAWSRRHHVSFSIAFSQDSEASLSELTALSEHHSLTKFVHSGDLTGLAELREYSPLSSNTIRQLLRYALDHCPPGSDSFWAIFNLIDTTSNPARIADCER